MKLCKRPLRRSIAEIISAADHDLLIASPYIKLSEVEWLLGLIDNKRSSTRLRANVLTDIRSDSILSGSLDVEALLLFSSRCTGRVVTLPRLHAKLYIADTSLALVTSANLTAGGLDTNFEYGLCIDAPEAVAGIRADVEAYSRLGNALTTPVLSELATIGKQVRETYRALEKTAEVDLKKRFNRELRKAERALLQAQVGRRTASSVFSEAILYILSGGPMATRELHPRVQQVLPDLCNDEVELVINGEHFGKKWKHAVRNAQQALKRSGKIVFDGKRWAILHRRQGSA